MMIGNTVLRPAWWVECGVLGVGLWGVGGWVDGGWVDGGWVKGGRIGGGMTHCMTCDQRFHQDAKLGKALREPKRSASAEGRVTCVKSAVANVGNNYNYYVVRN